MGSIKKMSKGIKVKLDKKRHLLITTDAIAAYERITGKQLVARSTIVNFSSRDLVVFVWACLLHEDSKLTLDEVAEMIKLQINWDSLIAGIQKAWDAYGKELEK